MPSTYAAIVATPLGKLGICIDREAITQLDFLTFDTPEYVPSDSFTHAVSRQLQAYFNNPQSPFTLPQAPQGTPFQQRVWQALRTIPVGSTVTYGVLAKQLGTSPRAIGGACRVNPLPIFTPCHRVVAQDGLGGYSGATEGRFFDTKAWLLLHEAKAIDGSRRRA